jgi:nitroreductase
MDLDKVLKTRASIKKYSLKKPKYDKVIDAIEAANLAPSPGNLPILKFIIIEDEEKIDKIAQACQQQFIKKAQILVVVCSDSKRTKIMYDKRTDKYIKHHAGAAIENFLLKITDMKLASCWIGAFSEVTIKDELKIPYEIEVEAVLPIAYQSKPDKTKQKSKPNLGNIIFFEKWGNKYKKEIRRIGNH